MRIIKEKTLSDYCKQNKYKQAKDSIKVGSKNPFLSF